MTEQTPPEALLDQLMKISQAATEAAEQAKTEAERATAGATAAQEAASSMGFDLPEEVLNKIGEIAGAAASAKTLEEFQKRGAFPDPLAGDEPPVPDPTPPGDAPPVPDPDDLTPEPSFLQKLFGIT